MKNHSITLAILIVFALCQSALANSGISHTNSMQDKSYTNGRFGYSFHLPQGFSEPIESDNGDGIVLQSTDEKAVIRVYGGQILDDSFIADNRQHFSWDKQAGWNISYVKISSQLAAWSGQKGNQILYNYTIPHCKMTMLTMNIRYDKTEKDKYDKLIPQWIKALKAKKCS